MPPAAQLKTREEQQQTKRGEKKIADEHQQAEYSTDSRGSFSVIPKWPGVTMLTEEQKNKSCAMVRLYGMMNAMKNWKMILMAAAMLLPVHAQEMEVEPTADDVLAAMREMTVSQGSKDVAGRIRKAKLKVPFSLSVRGETLAFQYKEGEAWKRFDVRINEKNVDIMQVDNGKAKVLPPAQYVQNLAGTDVCYEDLSLRFLYWKGGQMVDAGADSRIKGRDCYVVQVPNPNPAVGQFAWVRMWVDKENGTTWQIDGYGKDGKLKKRFSITSVQRLSDGTWFFKQMKLEVRNPENPNRTIALDYLEMDDLPGRK